MPLGTNRVDVLPEIENTSVPISRRDSRAIYTLDILLLLANALEPIEVNDDGSQIFSRLPQFWKA